MYSVLVLTFETTVRNYLRIFDVTPEHGMMIRNKHPLGARRSFSGPRDVVYNRINS